MREFFGNKIHKHILLTLIMYSQDYNQLQYFITYIWILETEVLGHLVLLYK